MWVDLAKLGDLRNMLKSEILPFVRNCCNWVVLARFTLKEQPGLNFLLLTINSIFDVRIYSTAEMNVFD